MPTINASESRTVTLQPGQVLKVTATSSATGTVDRLPTSSGGSDYGAPLPIAGANLLLGPYGIQTTLRFNLTGGSVTYDVAESADKQAILRFGVTAMTLDRDDLAKVIASTSASATTFTIPTEAVAGWQLGDTIIVTQLGAGALSLAAAGGVTIRKVSTQGLTLSAQYAVAQLHYIGPNEWLLFGAMGAA